MPSTKTEQLVTASLTSRRRKEQSFKLLGIAAIIMALFFLVTLMTSILSKAFPVFSNITLPLRLSWIANGLTRWAIYLTSLCLTGRPRKSFKKRSWRRPAHAGKEKKAARKLLSNGSDLRLMSYVQDNPHQLNSKQIVKFALDDDADSYFRGFVKKETPEKQRRLSDLQIQYLDQLNEDGLVSYEISDYLFFGSASRNAEMAGIKGAAIGSALTLVVCFVIAFPIGVATAVYLEEFAPKNRLTELIEININNLAAVPSVVFGILGLAIFINLFGMPRSIPLVGGMVLALMTLPTIIISSRAAIKAVPPSIRDGALGVGASKVQATMHHVVPLAIPGMLTGTIIGMAQALGETAPLLMIGMVAFIVDIPGGVTDPGTVLPVQIFMWADFAERMFIQKTSSAIIILLLFLIIMNGGAIWLRKKLERRW